MCRHAGCGAVVSAGRAWCVVHQPTDTKGNSVTRVRGVHVGGTFRDRGYNALWDSLSRRWRRFHPLCVMCMAQGQVVAGECVDHIIPINEGGALLDEGNLQTLCWSCHSRKTVREQHGKASVVTVPLASASDAPRSHDAAALARILDVGAGEK